MNIRMLNINDVDVTDEPLVYTCFGLGSCIGLFITDRMKRITGGAHIALPSSLNDGEFIGASHMINLLLNSFADMGSSLNGLSAKITGGANMFASSLDIGNQNVQAVNQHLINKKIFIAATDVGGTVSRTARFNSVTGELQIFTSEQKCYII